MPVLVSRETVPIAFYLSNNVPRETSISSVDNFVGN